MPRNPQPGYSEYEIVQADKLLDKHDGDRKKVAQALGIPIRRLHNMIRLTALRGKHGVPDSGGAGKTPLKSIPQGEAAEIHRQRRIKPVGNGGVLQVQSVEDVPTEALAVVEALNREDRQLAKPTKYGLAKLGQNEEEQAFLQNLEQSYTGSIRSMMDLTFAGMGHAFTRTLFLYEGVLKKIQEIDANPEEFLEMGEKGPYSTAHDKRVEYLRIANDYVDQLRKLNGATEKANEMRLQLQKLERENNQEGKVRGTPAWNPPVAKKVVNVQKNYYSTPPEQAKDKGGKEAD